MRGGQLFVFCVTLLYVGSPVVAQSTTESLVAKNKAGLSRLASGFQDLGARLNYADSVESQIKSELTQAQQGAGSASTKVSSAKSLYTNKHTELDASFNKLLKSLKGRVETIEERAHNTFGSLPWKQCSYNALNDGRDSGTIVTCSFKKRYDETYLRLHWYGDARVICNGCQRFYDILVDSAQCTVPGRIFASLHETKSHNNHRPLNVFGTCVNTQSGPIRAGTHTISLVTSGNGDAYTGWESTSRFMIEEIPPPHNL